MPNETESPKPPRPTEDLNTILEKLEAAASGRRIVSGGLDLLITDGLKLIPQAGIERRQQGEDYTVKDGLEQALDIYQLGLEAIKNRSESNTVRAEIARDLCIAGFTQTANELLKL